MGKSRMWRIAVLCFLASGMCATAYARFDLIDHSARATGRGGAFVATADDGGAFYYNPAGLTKIEGNLVQVDLLSAFRNTKYESPTGSGSEITQTILLPNMYMAFDPGIEKWKWGVGAYMPFGSSTDWGDTGPLRYAATFTQLQTWVINPAVSYQASDNVSLGFGYDMYTGSVISRKNISYGASFADSKYELLSDDAYASGYNLGLLVKTTEKSRIGVSYRSRFSMMFKGQATITNKPGGAPPESTPAKAQYNFPDVFMIGTAYDVNEKLNVGFDFQWTNWSEFSGYQLDFDPSTASLSDQWVEKNYHDSFLYKLGGEYKLSDATCLRMGAAYSSEAMPATTHTPPNSFDPSNPSQRRYSGYLGWGYKKDRLRLDLVLGLTVYADRNVANSGTQRANGWYETMMPQAGVGLGWAF